MYIVLPFVVKTRCQRKFVSRTQKKGHREKYTNTLTTNTVTHIHYTHLIKKSKHFFLMELKRFIDPIRYTTFQKFFKIFLTYSIANIGRL